MYKKSVIVYDYTLNYYYNYIIILSRKANALANWQSALGTMTRKGKGKAEGPYFAPPESQRGAELGVSCCAI